MMYQQQPDLVWREVEDGVVVVSPAGGEVRALNSLGSTVWSMLDGTQTLEQIVTELAERFPEIAVDQLRRDCEAFIDSLVSRNMVIPIDPKAVE